MRGDSRTRHVAARAACAALLGLFATLFAVTRPLGRATASEEGPRDQRTPKEALAEFNGLIGGWRGVGLPKRGSRDGAWTETAEWVWEFEEGVTGIRYEATDSKLIDTALLTWAPEAAEYRMAATLADGAERVYAGKLDKSRLVLESEPDAAGEVHRVSVTPLSEKRALVLFEKRRESSRVYSRVAEVGYTREGESLAVEGINGPECVVTGGKGTIQVSFEGETYYVCCTGCQQAFDNDPAGVIAEYKQKVAERTKK